MKIVSVIEPSTEYYQFIAGPAMFGAHLGGESDYQAIKYTCTFTLIMFLLLLFVYMITCFLLK